VVGWCSGVRGVAGIEGDISLEVGAAAVVQSPSNIASRDVFSDIPACRIVSWIRSLFPDLKYALSSLVKSSARLKTNLPYASSCISYCCLDAVCFGMSDLPFHPPGPEPVMEG
jgi:hypothetical protein